MSTPFPPQSSVATGAASPVPVPGTSSSLSLTQRILWLAAALVIAVVAIFAIVILFTQALGPLILLALAIIIGEAIRPLVAWLGHHHIPAPLAVLGIYLVLVVIGGALIWLFLDPIVKELSSLSNHLPQYQKQLQANIDQLQRQLRANGSLSKAVQNLSGALAAAVQHSAPQLVAVPFDFLKGIFGVLIDLVIILTMTLFWMLSSQKLGAYLVGLLPERSQAQASSVLSEVSLAFGGYVRGTLISMVIIGVVSGVGLALLGVPYAALLGVLAGLCELLPYLGPWIAGPVSVILALVAVGPLKALEVIILFILIQELEGNVVQPVVQSRSVHIDPLLVIVAVLIGINLLGIIGAILGVPIAAGLQVVFVNVVAPAARRRSESIALQGEAVPNADSPPAAQIPPSPEIPDAPDHPLAAPT